MLLILVVGMDFGEFHPYFKTKWAFFCLISPTFAVLAGNCQIW